MDDFIKKAGLHGTFAYLDDFVITGQTKEEHDVRLTKFLEAAQKFGMTINAKKSSFSVERISFLGHIIENGTLKPDPQRFDALMNYPMPTNARALHRLLGMFAYYSKWIPNCSEMTQRLANSKDEVSTNGSLSSDAVNAFEQLKKALQEAVLVCPDFSKSFVIETDASESSIGGTINQDGRPVAFFSRALTPTERKQSIVEREALAIIECCRKWRHFISSSSHTTVLTDQRSVAFLFGPQTRSKPKNEKLDIWRSELSELNIEISYRPGELNQAADALSRCASISDANSLVALHCRLCHPGVTRLHHFCKSRNLPFSLEEVRRVTSTCSDCRALKPRFAKPFQGRLIQATRP